MEGNFWQITWQRHRLVLLIIAALLVIQFILFKLLYPHPNFMPDSYGYLGVATDNNPIGNWPIGYSRFLRIESAFTRNDVVLVLLQYFFLQLSILYCLFRIAWYINLKRIILYLLAIIFTINPTALLISNYVAADALFTGLTLIWFCLLVEIMLHPKPKLVWQQAILLFVLFTIRYNALYYPFIATGVLLVTRMSWAVRIKGVLLMGLLLGGFILHNRVQYKELTGKPQFSPFGGWMLSGDALFMYSRMPKDKDKPPVIFAALQDLVDRHMDSLKKVKSRPDSTMGVYYIWNGPLRQYMNKQYQKDSTTSEFKRWSTMAPLYQEYGAYLIKKHPVSYARYFLLANTGYYFAPPAEFLDIYNQGGDSVGRFVCSWFGYKNGALKPYAKRIDIAYYVSVVNTLFNILFFTGLIGFLLLKGFSTVNQTVKRILLLTLVVTLFNFLFSVTLAPIVFRYHLFSFVLTGILGLALIGAIYDLGKQSA